MSGSARVLNSPSASQIMCVRCSCGVTVQTVEKLFSQPFKISACISFCMCMHMHVCMRLYACMRACVCVCVCARAHIMRITARAPVCLSVCICLSH